MTINLPFRSCAPIFSIPSRARRSFRGALGCAVASMLLGAANGCVHDTQAELGDNATFSEAALTVPGFQVHAATLIAPEYRASAYVEDTLAHLGPDAFTIGTMPVRAPRPNAYGIDADSTGRTIGGNLEYGDWISSQGARIVTDFASLQTELSSFKDAVTKAIQDNAPLPRRTVYVADGVTIDLGSATLEIAPGLTLAIRWAALSP
jgi:hypothetical protein